MPKFMFSTRGCQSVSALGTFVLAMTLHEDVQRKAREELDRVVGRDRLPSMDDQPDLPYVTAVVREVLRYDGALASCQ